MNLGVALDVTQGHRGCLYCQRNPSQIIQGGEPRCSLPHHLLQRYAIEAFSMAVAANRGEIQPGFTATTFSTSAALGTFAERQI